MTVVAGETTDMTTTEPQISLRRHAYEAIEPGDDVGVGIDIFIVGLILVNVTAFILETVPGVYAVAPWAFQWLEWVSLAVFSAEYIVRMWTAPEARRFTSRWKFAMRPMMVIDFLAIAPSLLVFLGVDLRFMRIFRTFRLLRLAKLIRYMQAMDDILGAIREKKHELVASFAIMLALLLFSSSVIFFLEHDAQPEAFSSIPAAMWWGVATLTTIGYGDIYPVTGAGRLIAGGISLLSLGFVAIPTSILASAFMDGVKKRHSMVPSVSDKCPACGK